MENCIRMNYLYMLRQLGIDSNEFLQQGIISVTTERRIRNGDISSISERTINALVEFYNMHGSELYPHHIELYDFKHTDLQKSTKPVWKNSDLVGDYIALFLSKRGTGRAKAMVIKISESAGNKLDVKAIDLIQDPERASRFIEDILNEEDLEIARSKHKNLFDKKNSLLRGSHFLHGEAFGRGSLLTISLTDDAGYEMTISTSLKSYISAQKKAPHDYKLRGGAALVTVCGLESWPYSMVIGIMDMEFWHSELMSNADIAFILQRMNSYQRKENMLCLDGDVDSLWYESFMDAHRRYKEKNPVRK